MVILRKVNTEKAFKQKLRRKKRLKQIWVVAVMVIAWKANTRKEEKDRVTPLKYQELLRKEEINYEVC